MIFIVAGCSKNENQPLTGKWVLTNSCICNTCSDTIPFFKKQTLIFFNDGKADLYISIGNSERYYPATYSISHFSYGEILNLNINKPDSGSSLEYIPGSIIYSRTATTLVLKLNTPFSNACAYVNTYSAYH